MRTPWLVAVSFALALALSACGSSGGTDAVSAGAITVSSSSDACTLSATTAPAGSTVFEVKNDGSDPTEFYVYAEDGQRIVGEVENIGPGLTRELTVVLAAGTYETACKPGMVGDGIRAPFAVTG